jgi:broad specificity phosphatase PhoE
MTARVLLVRHATHDLLGRMLCGRRRGVMLNQAGLMQAQKLGDLLALETPNAVYASPLERAQQTALPIAAACGQPLQTVEALIEIDFGAWTGESLDQLTCDDAWKRWNADRSQHRPPGGESMLEAQIRVARWLQYVSTNHAGQTVVAVSHGDVIKAVCCHALGLSLDFYGRFEIDPASVTTVLAGAWGLKLLHLNHTTRL